MSGEGVVCSESGVVGDEKRKHTLAKRRHGQDTGKHSLVVAVEHATDASKGGDPKDLEVLDEGPGTARAHESLAPLEGRIVGGRGICCAHVDVWNDAFSRSMNVVGYSEKA